MKKNYIKPEIEKVILDVLKSAMQAVASEQGIGYGGEDPGDGTIDPESKERLDDIFAQDNKYSLW